MSKQIIVSLKKYCGIDSIVPECNTAKLFAELAGTNTLTKPAIVAIKKLGYSVKVKQEFKGI